MSRRLFLQLLTALLGGFGLSAMAQTKLNSPFKPLEADWKILQVLSVARFQYYQGEALWTQLATGQPITLIRETGNPYDKRAVRIDWQGKKLSYIPLIDNAAVAQLMDRGETLSALITGLKKSDNP